MSIKTIQGELIEEFSFFDDWEQKYEYIIDLGKSLPIISSEYKTDQYLIRGCQSRVWLNAEEKDGRIYFTADSDAILTKGIIAIMVRVFSGSTPSEILDASLDFVDQIGLKEHLSPTRANGLVSMIKQIKMYALAFESKNKN
ncbi:MAG: SufE family protein [Bacteroidota bacterium]|nr:SufE family protein [Bacteroidota bacterium]